jgi:peptide-methionine (S)-S-oxide reductase
MITTEVAMLEGYTAGESYHQNYFESNPSAGYCAYIIRPKVDKFTQTHQQFLA